MRKTNDFAILPFNTARIRGKYLVSNALGAWDLLELSEFRELNSFRLDRGSPLFARLKERGLIVDETNLSAGLEDFRRSNGHLFKETFHHIAVVTTRCQGTPGHGIDMAPDVAVEVLMALFPGVSRGVTLELKGGEPLLNWAAVQFMVDNARQMNSKGIKDLKIVLVTDLLLADDERMKFLAEHGVQVKVLLDGPRTLHDKIRGGYAKAARNIKRFQETFGGQVTLVSTMTAATLKDPRGLVEEYLRQGQQEISLSPLNALAPDAVDWHGPDFSAKAFVDFYARAMDYIFELNERGILIRERTACSILTKVLAKRDPEDLDLMVPGGLGRLVMAYAPDGTCYPSDEARRLGPEIFRLGDILKEKNVDMIKKEELTHVLQSSCAGLWHYASAYSPWTGESSVMNYALQRNVVVKARLSPFCRILERQFGYIFDKICSGEHSDIFNRWVGGKNNG